VRKVLTLSLPGLARDVHEETNRYLWALVAA
jgi:hypothetical protein